MSGSSKTESSYRYNTSCSLNDSIAILIGRVSGVKLQSKYYNVDDCYDNAISVCAVTNTNIV